MATKGPSAQPQSFDQIVSRLDEIVDAVRSKDTSLERSLDLFDEAVSLGSKAVELVDSTELTDEERARVEAASEKGAAADGPVVADAADPTSRAAAPAQGGAAASADAADERAGVEAAPTVSQEA